MSKSNSAPIKLGKHTATATYRRLDTVAKPGAKVEHHDFVEHSPDAALERFKLVIAKRKK